MFMEAIDVGELRSEIDLEGKYVEFEAVRSSVTLARLVDRLDMEVSTENENGEVRAACPKCGKERGLSLNLETGRFNCFQKGCGFRGGGVIDFFGKLNGVFAKESAHLLAALFEIEPYGNGQKEKKKPGSSESTPAVTEGKSTKPEDYVRREEFEKVEQKLSRLSRLVYSYVFEDESEGKERVDPGSAA